MDLSALHSVVTAGSACGPFAFRSRSKWLSSEGDLRFASAVDQATAKIYRRRNPVMPTLPEFTRCSYLRPRRRCLLADFQRGSEFQKCDKLNRSRSFRRRRHCDWSAAFRVCSPWIIGMAASTVRGELPEIFN